MSNPLDRVPLSVQSAFVRALLALPKPIRRRIAGKPVRIDGQELALDAQLFLLLEKASGYRLVNGTPEQARQRLAASRSLVSGPPIEPVTVRALTIEDSVPARFYAPEGVGDDAPLLVYYHGGGWVVGDLDSHDNVSRFLAKRAGVKVLSVDYRLAPEHRFPAAVDDALTAFNHAVKNAAELGIDPDRIAVGGDSAGGNLAAVTALQAVRAGGAVPKFQLLIYPAVDASVRRRSRELFADGFFLTSADMDWFREHYAPNEDDRVNPLFSPLLAEDLTGLPPAYVATAGFDPLRDEGEAYAERLKESGVKVIAVRYPDLIHGYFNFLGVGRRFQEAAVEAAVALRTALAL
ncbi:Esterase/lipase [Alloactinosynnema sp. L-07]|uniref:alpha/beta hydrolase n=1 Tax=Alloactinosynnema sp. L-07 TaxID=1653480 RepID=UPI00065EFCBB|nr:alpha/beta hydrolase [Alloactinosynnema sp. L-07]CRK61020.1 Esterase/lipase [Alloactinosynnema sp. L-07]